MSAHNLESFSLTDMMNELARDVDAAWKYAWVDNLLASWGSGPAPFASHARITAHVLQSLRGLRYNAVRRSGLSRAERLEAIIQINGRHPRAIFIEYVDAPDIETVLDRFILRKGVLWETQLTGVVVCWHPDKDFKPAWAVREHRTGHSALGRKERRRIAARHADAKAGREG